LIFTLHTRAAPKVLPRRQNLIRSAAEITAIRVGRGKSETANSQVAGQNGPSLRRRQWLLLLPLRTTSPALAGFTDLLQRYNYMFSG
jgi:hypothetical protein